MIRVAGRLGFAPTHIQKQAFNPMKPIRFAGADLRLDRSVNYTPELSKPETMGSFSLNGQNSLLDQRRRQVLNKVFFTDSDTLQKYTGMDILRSCYEIFLEKNNPETLKKLYLEALYCPHEIGNSLNELHDVGLLNFYKPAWDQFMETPGGKNIIKRTDIGDRYMAEAVLNQTFFHQNLNPVTGLHILRQAYEMLEKKYSIWPRDFQASFLAGDESESQQVEVSTRVLAVIKVFQQLGLIIRAYNDSGTEQLQKSSKGVEYAGVIVKKDAPPKSSVSPQSTLQKIQAQKELDLQKMAEELKLSQLQVLTASYANDTHGWDVLNLVYALMNKNLYRRLAGSGVKESEILQNFVLDASKEQIKQALNDLKQVGLMDNISPSAKSEAVWHVNGAGQTRVHEEDPIKSGALTPEVLTQFLQAFIDKLRTEQKNQREGLNKFEVDAQKAIAVVEQIKADYEAENTAALSLLNQADSTEDTAQKKQLEREAVLQAQLAKVSENRLQLEQEFLKLMNEQVETAQQKFAVWTKKMEGNINRLITTQARIRFTELNNSIKLLVTDIGEVSKQDVTTPWAAIAKQINLDYYVSNIDMEKTLARKRVMESVTQSQYRETLLELREKQQGLQPNATKLGSASQEG